MREVPLLVTWDHRERKGPIIPRATTHLQHPSKHQRRPLATEVQSLSMDLTRLPRLPGNMLMASRTSPLVPWWSLTMRIHCLCELPTTTVMRSIPDPIVVLRHQAFHRRPDGHQGHGSPRHRTSRQGRRRRPSLTQFLSVLGLCFLPSPNYARRRLRRLTTRSIHPSNLR